MLNVSYYVEESKQSDVRRGSQDFRSFVRQKMDQIAQDHVVLANQAKK